ncbi:MAG: hypothetical protein L6R42_006962 [Xanthoria sp. 1 TBL-2021]|nr:MAG: hypothetical protein L6R42_006962 [Xanthoria sp. 1 TBL-2021]
MPSILRNSVPPSSIETSAIVRKTIPSPPQKKQKMSLTQTYYLAHTARGKLSKEAAQADHNLRRLVGHANLLDGLMLDLADAEREQESWFNQTVKGATKASESPRHIQWADSIEEAIEDDDEYSDNESDSDDEVEQIPQIPARRLRQEVAPTPIVTIEEDSDEEMTDDEDNEEELALTRTNSNQPPELLHESDSESDDDMPLSPPQPNLPLDAFSEKQRQAIATTGSYQPKHEAIPSVEDQTSFFEEGFFIPRRQEAPNLSAF